MTRQTSTFLVAAALALSTAVAGCAVQPVAPPPPPAEVLAARAQSHHDSHSQEDVDPFLVLSALVEGNDRFMSGRGAHPRQSPGIRAELSKGQKPKAIVISCSDSRVPPEIIFDQGLGDIFVVRAAGELVDQYGLASVEYALEHLGSNLIVVLGHESCGAVKAAVTTPEGTSAGSQNLDALVHHLHGLLHGSAPSPNDTALNGPVRTVVDGVAEELTTKSSIIREKVDSGHVKVVRGVYRLASGKVDFWH